MSNYCTNILCIDCCSRIAVCECGKYTKVEKLEYRIMELEGTVRLRTEERDKLLREIMDGLNL